MKFSKKMYIDGDLSGGQNNLKVFNPATEAEVAELPAAGLIDVEKALLSAKNAFPIWSRTSIEERQSWMNKLRDAVIFSEKHLRECVHYEMGKPWKSTKEDFDSLKNSLEFYANEIGRFKSENLPDRAGSHIHRLVHEPAGVVVAFLAWNFPLLNLAFKIGPAMAAGCPIVIRPSGATPISAYAVGELCHKIGLPRGVVNIICTVDSKSTDALSSSKIPSLLTLIGSTATGKHIMKTGATSIKRYSMELGGNAPVIVFADSDLNLAADIVCAVKFSNAGQICVTPNRIFVEESVAIEFERKVVERAKLIRIGFDKDVDIDMGPLIDASAWNRVNDLVAGALEAGARLLTGGGRPDKLVRGHYYSPTVLSNINPTMQIYQNEIFGPVVSILAFKNEIEVLANANDGEDGGLTAFLFTRDINKAERFASELRYGEIQINGIKYDIDLPHGGIGQSGIGHDCSSLALHDYLVVKRISRALLS